MSVLVHTVTPEEKGRSVRELLTARFAVSSSLRKVLAQREGAILLNGKAVFLSTRAAAGDVLTVDVSDAEGTSSVMPVDFPLTVLWEDEHLLAVDKPAGITVHGAALTEEAVTVAGAAAHYLGSTAVHVVNRLDRGTSGVMLIAKSSYLHARCMELLHTDSFCREYRAVCEGVPSPPQGLIDAPIGRDETSLLRRCVRADGQRAVTEYEVLSVRQGRALVCLLPRTGRTHQLRVHMASIGHPLAGDWLYGTENKALIARPALHSYRLRFTHPLTGQVVEVTAPLPEDMLRLMEEM
ncbi:MAG: RluA family pseudouridine synthase [Ruminococcaceae bacterium]|nr:RluA family pseudouridine synthase [Oscillospiraceae bacterium]